MKPVQLWYVLLPECKKYVGPFEPKKILKLLQLGRIKIDSYIWSPQNPKEKWRMVIEYGIFQEAISNPKFLFTLQEEEYLKVYRILTKKVAGAENRLSWFESYIQLEVQKPNVKDIGTMIHSAPIPRRSKRVSLDQTIYAKTHGCVRKASEFIISKNGVYFNVLNPIEFQVGSELGIATVDTETNQTINFKGLVTCEDDAPVGKNIGIRFVDMNPDQRSFVEKLVNTASAA